MKIFISHSNEDKARVREILANMELRKPIDVLIDEKTLVLGDDIEAKLKKDILYASDFLMIFLSNSSTQSEWVMKELKWGLKREKEIHRKFILPILLDEVWTSRISAKLNNRMYIKCLENDIDIIRAKAKKIRDALHDIAIDIAFGAEDPKQFPINKKIFEDEKNNNNITDQLGILIQPDNLRMQYYKKKKSAISKSKIINYIKHFMKRHQEFFKSDFYLELVNVIGTDFHILLSLEDKILTYHDFIDSRDNNFIFEQYKNCIHAYNEARKTATLFDASKQDSIHQLRKSKTVLDKIKDAKTQIAIFFSDLELDNDSKQQIDSKLDTINKKIDSCEDTCFNFDNSEYTTAEALGFFSTSLNLAINAIHSILILFTYSRIINEEWD